MNARVVLLVRLILVAALFPALAGCTAEESLHRADLKAAPPVAPIAPGWAPAELATIRPGVPIRTAAGDCPSNFVFARPDNSSIFIGTTAACVQELPIGSVATIGGEMNLAVLAYSSWATMAELGETDSDALEYNDFAVFYIDSSSRDEVNPALPLTGGPAGPATPQDYALGARVRSYVANSTLPGWRDGIVTGAAGDWALLAYNAVPPGAMGGAVLDPEGRAVGIVVNLGVVPNPGANGVARLDTAMAYAREHAKLDMVLATSSYTPASTLQENPPALASTLPEAASSFT